MINLEEIIIKNIINSQSLVLFIYRSQLTKIWLDNNIRVP